MLLRCYCTAAKHVAIEASRREARATKSGAVAGRARSGSGRMSRRLGLARAVVVGVVGTLPLGVDRPEFRAEQTTPAPQARNLAVHRIAG